MMKRRWSLDEIRYLRLNAAILPADQLAANLGRSLYSLRGQAVKHRIRLRWQGGEPDALAAERQARIVERPIR